jgi:hypothetical protein
VRSAAAITAVFRLSAILTPALSLRGRGSSARLGLAVAVLLSLARPGATDAGIADQIGATFGLMVQDIADAFPHVEGLVAMVQGEQLFIALNVRDAMQPGQELVVFRKGEVFRHPLNQRPLGRFEDILGHAQVKRIYPDFAEAAYVPIEGKPPVRAEDGVRITRGRIRVAVTPVVDLTSLRADLRRVPFMLALGLEQTKRFQAVDSSVVQDQLLNSQTRPEQLFIEPDRAVSLGRPLEIAGWLVPVLMERRGAQYLDVTWISAATGRALLSRRLSLVRGLEAAGEPRFPWEPRVQD